MRLLLVLCILVSNFGLSCLSNTNQKDSNKIIAERIIDYTLTDLIDSTVFTRSPIDSIYLIIPERDHQHRVSKNKVIVNQLENLEFADSRVRIINSDSSFFSNPIIDSNKLINYYFLQIDTITIGNPMHAIVMFGPLGARYSYNYNYNKETFKILKRELTGSIQYQF